MVWGAKVVFDFIYSFSLLSLEFYKFLQCIYICQYGNYGNQTIHKRAFLLAI